MTHGSRTSRSQPKKKKKRRRRALDRCAAEISPTLLEEINKELAATTEYARDDSPPLEARTRVAAEGEGFSRESQAHRETKKTGLDGDFADLNDRVDLVEEL